LELDSNSIKAIFRRARAFIEKDQWEDAMRDLNRAQEMDPDNADIHKEMRRLKQRMMKQDQKDKQIFSGIFEKLLMYEDKPEPPPAGKTFIQRFFATMTTPGITAEHMRFINYIFLALFITLSVILLVKGSQASIHMYVLALLSLGLFLCIHW
jgi:hypothetical protein